MRIFPLSRFIVKEESMLPALAPDERVLTFNWVSWRVDDVIVFKVGSSCYIKRVLAMNRGKILVAGDNKMASVRPRKINRGQVVGKVILKY